MYVCTCTTKLYVLCTGAYNYYKKMIITITLPITHLFQINNIVLDSFLRFTNQIRLNKLYLYYMYPIIYIRGHYYIFNNYLYLNKNCLWYILIIIIIIIIIIYSIYIALYNALL